MSLFPPDAQIGISDLIQRIACELVAARDHLHHVELALDNVPHTSAFPKADAVGAGPVQSLSHIARLQSLDLVMQLLAELAGCLNRLSQEQALIHLGSVDARDILHGLRLADLQRRLSNVAVPAQIQTPVELF